MKCHICGNEQRNTLHYPKEMMYGLRESFEYQCCGECGMVQITAIPEALGNYYGDEYSSFKKNRETLLPPLLAKLRACRTRHYLGNGDPLGALISLFSRRPPYFDWVAPFNLTLNSSILDVGCGSGGLLLKLRREGFTDLLGVDLFLAETREYACGVRILAASLDQVTRCFDLIMLHHSLEHMPDQHAALASVRERLNPGGGVLIRIPMANCYAHRRYGVHWAAWDPPRHLYLHTVRSLHHLAKMHGFAVFDVRYDSGTEGILGSEYYQRDIPRVEWPNADRSGTFSPQTRKAAEDLARQLNTIQDGDTACFYLRPIQ
ncbi:MAG: class I SAM-dependent methyltransferase [Magnetococcales bacterium]|nr:class I SAM-dependent methyltransferase [Magnetococcales bacterium]